VTYLHVTSRNRELLWASEPDSVLERGLPPLYAVRIFVLHVVACWLAAGLHGLISIQRDMGDKDSSVWQWLESAGEPKNRFSNPAAWNLICSAVGTPLRCFTYLCGLTSFVVQAWIAITASSKRMVSMRSTSRLSSFRTTMQSASQNTRSVRSYSS